MSLRLKRETSEPRGRSDDEDKEVGRKGRRGVTEDVKDVEAVAARGMTAAVGRVGGRLSSLASEGGMRGILNSRRSKLVYKYVLI